MQVKTVFIDLLPASWDEDYVRDTLKKYGEIEKVELARNMPAARRKNYGFITFATHAAAVECADSITSAGLGEGDKKVCLAFKYNVHVKQLDVAFYNASSFFQAKVRARLSRPLRRSRGKHITHRDRHSDRNFGRLARPSRSRPEPRSVPARVVRRIGNRVPPVRPSRLRDRRPVTSMPVRARPVTPPARSYDRRLAGMNYIFFSPSRVPVVNSFFMTVYYDIVLLAPAYPKSSMKRDYGRCVDLPPPRGRVSADYGSQAASQRRPSYKDYPARGSGYPELHRSASRAAPRRGYLDDGYGQRLERPPPPPPHLSYREGRPRDYDTLSGSKRPYTAMVNTIVKNLF